ncbi:hypothetical protein O181_082167 [Austropuccinia psidii MF-1]|uniref:Ubiquitin carboxyl-terminal hydrolase n=1 Tax=Austropuccinia psidii MF-1 TaxID=1389203 RepID=A0A9Q3FPX7_9BASI|nr:hypothetical protein [Austropuccinia psidii MF-1]
MIITKSISSTSLVNPTHLNKKISNQNQNDPSKFSSSQPSKLSHSISTPSISSNSSVSSLASSPSNGNLNHSGTSILPGLANLGNTCFMNAILQSFNAAQSITNLLIYPSNQVIQSQPLLQQLSIKSNSNYLDQIPILSSLSKVIYHLSTQSGSFKPINLLNHISTHHKDYQINQQQDAHEFLHILLDLIRNEEVKFLIQFNHPTSPLQTCHSYSSLSSSSPITSNSQILQNVNHHQIIDNYSSRSTHLAHLVSSSSSDSSNNSLTQPASFSNSNSSSASSTTSIDPLISSSTQPKSHLSLLDSVFSGCLSQYTICERLHVSKVVEEFLDLSLATKDGTKNIWAGKRTRLKKHFQNRFKPSSTNKLNTILHQTIPSPSFNHPTHHEPMPRRSSISNTQTIGTSDQTTHQPNRNRRLSLDSCRDFNFCTPKISLWKPTPFHPSNKLNHHHHHPDLDPVVNQKNQLSPIFSSSKQSTRDRSQIDSLNKSSLFKSSSSFCQVEAHKQYVREILSESQKPNPSLKYLRALRFTSQPNSPTSSCINLEPALDTGLHSLLRRFTAVEVLDGDNSFACSECWKTEIQNQELNQTSSLTPIFSSQTICPQTSSEPNWDNIPTIRISTRSICDIDSQTFSPKQNQHELDEKTSKGLSYLKINDHHQLNQSQDHKLENNSSKVIHSNSHLLDSQVKGSSTSVIEQVEQYVMCRAFKRYLFAKLPKILVIHLQRFEAILKSGLFNKQISAQWTKTDDYISFPEKLDLSPFISPELHDETSQIGQSNRGFNYRLISVIVHRGQMGSGHYFNYVLTDRYGNQDGSVKKNEDEIDDHQNEGKQWVYCSDTEIKRVTLNEVLKSKAYILFYEQT